jgi:hypothetical protein
MLYVRVREGEEFDSFGPFPLDMREMIVRMCERFASLAECKLTHDRYLWDGRLVDKLSGKATPPTQSPKLNQLG